MVQAPDGLKDQTARAAAAGEMVFPWMFEEFEALRPLKEAADILASKADWPQLYKVETLSRNSVPVAGATYYEDMYVDFELAQVRSEPAVWHP